MNVSFIFSIIFCKPTLQMLIELLRAVIIAASSSNNRNTWLAMELCNVWVG